MNNAYYLNFFVKINNQASIKEGKYMLVKQKGTLFNRYFMLKVHNLQADENGLDLVSKFINFLEVQFIEQKC